MDVVQWYGVALAALAAVVLAASHPPRPMPSWLLRHLAYPRLHPLIGGTGDITRFKAIVIGVFLVGNVLCSGLGVRTSSDLAKRTGQLFTVNAIPLFLGGKIGPLVNILRIQYDDFAKAHRWLGRVAAAHAVVHAAVAVSSEREFHSRPQVAGLVAISATCASIVLSFGAVRRYTYELFAKLHLALAVLLIVAVWMHIASRSVLRPPEVYLLAVCCTYGSTLAVWFVHAISRNYSHHALFALAMVHKTRAPSGGAVQLVIKLPRACTFRPGQFVYVRMLTLRGFAFLQSHPFYLYSWDGKTITLLIERQRGFTAGLVAEDALSSLSRTDLEAKGTGVRAMIEGPFGKSFDLSHYRNVVLFATGIGIVTQLSHMQQWVKDQHSHFTPHTQKVHLFWEIEAEEQKFWAEEAMNNLLSIDTGFALRIRVFVKSSPGRRAGDESAPTKVHLSKPKRVSYCYKPIDAGTEIRNQLKTAEGNTVIAVCSDDLTTATIRREVCRTAWKGKDLTLEVFDIVPGQQQSYWARLRASLAHSLSKTAPSL